MPGRTRIVHVLPPSVISGSATAVFGTSRIGRARWSYLYSVSKITRLTALL